jgi:hypothetical protein
MKARMSWWGYRTEIVQRGTSTMKKQTELKGARTAA